jgi:hypothetical protein
VVYTPTTWEAGALGPRSIALCLSFYAQRNIPHQRGRVYLGPWTASQVVEKPTTIFLNSIVDLGHGLYNIQNQGAISWTHSTHSTVTGEYHDVTNYWCNDVWDVQHSRAHSETLRAKYP